MHSRARGLRVDEIDPIRRSYQSSIISFPAGINTSADKTGEA
jgi:hypothetical protein